MTLYFKRLQTLVFAMLLHSSMAASAFELKTAPIQDNKELVSLLQKGGYILYVRHGITDHSEKDELNPNFESCSNQRNLSKAGVEQTQFIGRKLKALNINVAKAWSSPYCRCQDTAKHIFNHYDVNLDLQFSMSKNAAEARELGIKLKEMMLALPDNGQNYAFIGHTSNLKDGLGVWPKPEGAFAIFKKQGGQIHFVGMIHPNSWSSIE